MKKKSANLMSKFYKTLFAFMLVSCFMISGTLAKYVTNASASDSARVARFDVASNLDSKKSLSLFDTLYDTDGRRETDVKSHNGDKVIAPGTQGNFEVVINNKSEVSIEYELEVLCKNDKNIPIEFSTDKKNWTNVNAKPLKVKNSLPVSKKGNASVTVYWRWQFEKGRNASEKEANDRFDTSLGTAKSVNTTVTIKGTFTQLD